ncbi:MAG: glycosyltransferase family 2 protein [bacterium]
MKKNKEHLNTTPKVIVLILSYNGKHLLKEAIDSYLANDYPNYEVVVIDNGSVDDTKAYVEANWRNVKVIRTEKNLGYSGGANFGLEYAFDKNNADFVLFTNNDVHADNNVIKSLVETALIDDKIAFTVGKVYYYDNPDTLHSVGKKFDEFWWNGGHIGRNEKDVGQYDKISERHWCDDIYWLINRKVYEDIGGYDTEFFLQSEDFDYQARAKKKGYKIFYTPEAKLWHMTSATIGRGSAYVIFFEVRNKLIVQMKHRAKEMYEKVITTKRLQIIKATPKLLVKMRFKYVFRMWKGYFSALRWGRRNGKLKKWI